MGDVFDGAFTEVTNPNGDRQTIPTAWLGTPLGEGFTVAESESPSEEWTIDRLRQYAADHDIDLTGAGTRKADVLARITNPGTPADRGEE